MLNREKIELAYKILKHEVYYDKNDLMLRCKLAEFENQKDFPNFWENIINIFKKFQYSNENTTITKYLESIDFVIIPKSFDGSKNNSEHDKPNYLTNISTKEKYIIDKVNYHIKAPVELHIISTLWCMYAGVLLDKEFSDKCYGYRINPNLYCDNNETGNLFKFYPEQYSGWRDNGLKKAKKLLNSKEDVAILALDIEQFYYSIEFNFDKLKNCLNDKRNDKDSKDEDISIAIKLTEIIEVICKRYNSKIKHLKELTHPCTSNNTLPLGMNFSPILANWFISDFDKAIEKKINPEYYGRYVDDMLIVLANPTINEKDSFKSFVHDYFIKTDILAEKDSKYVFKDNHNLRINDKKVLLQHFSKDHSQASLEKFVNKIKQNSSEFRYLPEDDIDEKFDEVAYDLLYKGSPNKLSNVIGITENKYEMAKFLGCKISLLIHSHHKPDFQSNSELLFFFSGKTGLEYFSLWERCLTYLIVSKSYKNAETLINNLIKSVEKVTYINDSLENARISEQLKTFFNNHIVYSIVIPLALKNYIPEYVQKTLYKIFDEQRILRNVKDIRKANLIRHNYISLPLTNYTDYKNDYTEFNILNVSKCKFKDKKIALSPRFIHMDEFLIYSYYTNPTEVEPDKLLEKYNKIVGQFLQPTNYGDLSCKIENRYCGKNDKEKCPKDGSFWDIKVNKEKQKFKEKIKVGIVNLKVKDSDIEASYKNKPAISIARHQELNATLNLATRENCDLLIMPELSVPFRWFQDLIYYSKKRQIGLILGLEYFVDKGYAYNYLATILPYIDSKKRKYCYPNLRLKKHYAYKETELLKGNRLNIPPVENESYSKFEWQGLHFCSYNCFELADIHHRSMFKSMVDLVVACEYNKDVSYFSNIAESVSRDLHCYYIQVNSSNYGDSRIVSPSKKDFMDVVKVKGGENTTILTATLDIKALREHQHKTYSLQKNSEFGFKPTPPNYDVDILEKRR
ncbi:reverse transcriptase domain-containing protein [Sedimentisphaera salicampi]|uniref:Reverse transcriptase (RNA-dependent DNA polymerase) n=1 Tax=Sedimentisphaera salicampi TaxID=1941349 RepID=A0A1W6LM70_9BACT|nr:reverse transcriptase domain-containing protein [Sedimentisphaera salicampi]ARN56867.1 Reverse transcriptase (RNA-dependent DNA polymerase) [Sedimentisphaera salicampi]